MRMRTRGGKSRDCRATRRRRCQQDDSGEPDSTRFPQFIENNFTHKSSFEPECYDRESSHGGLCAVEPVLSMTMLACCNIEYPFLRRVIVGE